MSDIHRSALVRLLYKNNETLTRQNAELRAWKAKARPFLEVFCQILAYKTQHGKEYDLAFYYEDFDRELNFGTDHNELTELLGGDDE